MDVKFGGFFRILSMLLALGSSGCAEIAPRYAISADNVAAIRSKITSKIDVRVFTQEPSVALTGVQCAAMKISPPDGQSFSEYIKSALISELKVADRFASESENLISGNLTKISLEASPLSFVGRWLISATVSDGRNSTQVVEEYSFRYSGTMTACQAAAANLSAAVQNLVGKIVTSPALVDSP